MATKVFSDFISHINKYEISRPYLFDVQINIPKALIKDESLSSFNSSLMFSCETAELPGRTFALAQQKIYGPIQQFPTLTAYNNLDLAFICRDKDFMEKVFFDSWFELINPKENFNFKYKTENGVNTYQTEIFITQYSQKGTPLYRVKLIEAFPVNMGIMRLSWESSGFNRLLISFAYTKWESVEIKDNESNANIIAQYEAIKEIQEIKTTTDTAGVPTEVVSSFGQMDQATKERLNNSPFPTKEVESLNKQQLSSSEAVPTKEINSFENGKMDPGVERALQDNPFPIQSQTGEAIAELIKLAQAGYAISTKSPGYIVSTLPNFGLSDLSISNIISKFPNIK